MSVVLRCSSCGTTTTRPGECEACHEASVRYFCTNHAPGIWLDSAACPQCGARFGAAARPPASVRVGPAPAPSTRSRTPAPRVASPAPSRYSGPPPRKAVLHVREESEPPRFVAWQELLRAAIRARYSPKPRAPGRLALGGCVMRLLLLAMLALLALGSALFMMGRSLLY